jgi:hypothetical protein
MASYGLEELRIAAERRQREYELDAALRAARVLQAMLEILDDRSFDVAVVRSLRDSLARDIAALDQ